MLLVGCISHDDKSPLPPQPWPGPHVSGRDPALFDGHPRIGVHVLLEFLFMGRIGGRLVVRHDRVCDVYESEEGLRS